MKSVDAIRAEIEGDLQTQPYVLYLEGGQDVAMFFALLGVSEPPDGILVRALSGATAVRAYVEVATQIDLWVIPGEGGVAGIVDGDGRPLSALAAEFDAPHVGPLFSWKGYSLENLLARTAWPDAWGAPLDWSSVLAEYAPCAALNVVQRELQTALQTLGLAKFTNPVRPPQTEADIKATLAEGKHVLADRDVEAMFDATVFDLRAAIARSPDEGHAVINGKWLVDHYAPVRTGLTQDRCRDAWIHAVRAAGGLPEVRDLWQRITGAAPEN